MTLPRLRSQPRLHVDGVVVGELAPATVGPRCESRPGGAQVARADPAHAMAPQATDLGTSSSPQHLVTAFSGQERPRAPQLPEDHGLDVQGDRPDQASHAQRLLRIDTQQVIAIGELEPDPFAQPQVGQHQLLPLGLVGLGHTRVELGDGTGRGDRCGVPGRSRPRGSPRSPARRRRPRNKGRAPGKAGSRLREQRVQTCWCIHPLPARKWIRESSSWRSRMEFGR